MNGEAAIPLPVERAAVVRGAIERSDWQALFDVDPEWDPGWCRECGAHHCDAHWHKSVEFDDGSYDCTWGDCPSSSHRGSRSVTSRRLAALRASRCGVAVSISTAGAFILHHGRYSAIVDVPFRQGESRGSTTLGQLRRKPARWQCRAMAAR